MPHERPDSRRPPPNPRPRERERVGRGSRANGVGFAVALATATACLPEGPPGLGELVFASDGLQEALPADGPFGDGRSGADGLGSGARTGARRPLLVHGHLRDSEAGYYPSLYLVDGGAPRWLADDAVLLAQPWGQDGSYWFATYGTCEVDGPGVLGCPSDTLDRLARDGQVTQLFSGARLVTFQRVGPWTSATLSDHRGFVRRDDGVDVAVQGSLLPLGRWYFAVSAANAQTLVRFSDDDPTPQVVATGVISWSWLPVAPRPLGWLVVKREGGSVVVDPDTLETQRLPVDLLAWGDRTIRPDGKMIAAFARTPAATADASAQITFIDPLTWETQTQEIPLGSRFLDTWRATWRPGTEDLWVGTTAGTGMAPTLYSLSPARPPRAFAMFDIASGKENADARNGELLTHSAALAPFFGFESAFSRDGSEVLVSDADGHDAWLDVSAPDAPLRPVVPTSVQANWIIESQTPGAAWTLGTAAAETSLWSSARPPGPGLPPRLAQVARGVSLVWVGPTRALAIVRRIGANGTYGDSIFGAGGHGDLVLLDADGKETWIASNVISFTPVPSCAECDALAPGSRLIYVVNASRPWHRNGVWECTLP